MAGYATLTILGLILLYKGTTDQQTTILIDGTLCLIFGVMAFVSAIRNALWRLQL
jgi:uncharacterized membrane protein HdeD (DUF308 family)